MIRSHYIDEITGFIDKPQVKVLTGVRRAGKSCLLKQVKRILIEKGISEACIIELNFESLSLADYTNVRDFYTLIQDQIKPNQKYYLLLDEIQEVEEWEKAISSFLVDFDTDIYITGSNAHLLSSELATYLTGRYVEIPVFTLSYAEFLDFRKHYFSDSESLEDPFLHYLRMGGFPVIHTAGYTPGTAYKVIFDIYSSVILRDTIQRHNIRDIELLERIVKFAFDNIGNTFSGKNIADFFKSQQRKVDVNTVYNYLLALEGAFVLHRVSRYDIRGKEILKTLEKFYVSDVSLIYATMGYKDQMISGLLENIVFLELKRRGYKVFTGKFGQREIDFVAEKQGEKVYVQVAYKLESNETVEREFLNLASIKDQYPKYVVSMDTFWKENVEGVKHCYITDFLLKK